MVNSEVEKHAKQSKYWLVFAEQFWNVVLTEAAFAAFESINSDPHATIFELTSLAQHTHKPLLFTEDVLAVLRGQKSYLGPKMLSSNKSGADSGIVLNFKNRGV